MTDQERKEALNEKFQILEGWKDNIEFRVKEKEDDATRINTKLLAHLENLLINTSLLALTNEQISELIKQTSSFLVEIQLEAKTRGI